MKHRTLKPLPHCYGCGCDLASDQSGICGDCLDKAQIKELNEITDHRRQQREHEAQLRADSLEDNKAFAACFKAVFFTLAVCDEYLGKLSRWIKTKLN